jgi:hypothetical protein
MDSIVATNESKVKVELILKLEAQRLQVHTMYNRRNADVNSLVVLVCSQGSYQCPSMTKKWGHCPEERNQASFMSDPISSHPESIVWVKT